MGRIPLTVGLLLTGCLAAPGFDPPSTGTLEQTIVNGARAPQVVPMSEGQQLAVGLKPSDAEVVAFVAYFGDLTPDFFLLLVHGLTRIFVLGYFRFREPLRKAISGL